MRDRDVIEIADGRDHRRGGSRMDRSNDFRGREGTEKQAEQELVLFGRVVGLLHTGTAAV